MGALSPVVLLVDSSRRTAELLSTGLRCSGVEVRCAGSGAAALAAIIAYSPDVVVVDVVLPDMDGYRVVRQLRATGNTQPVLFLSARNTVEDRLIGLAAGGDDYVGKPFDLDEVIARIQMLLRRSRRTYAEEPGQLRCADLILDVDAHTVYRAGHQLWPPATEFALLHYLMTNTGIVMSRQQILERIWGDAYGRSYHVIDNSVSRLQRRIDEFGPPLVHTVRGIGYILRSLADTRPPRTGNGNRAGLASRTHSAGIARATAGHRTVSPVPRLENGDDPVDTSR
ncbi:response regulator transcription factor [Nocardia sp. alder85J]|uniref:response regulator transcription factor n=1 Tax=Nocardia sp. alder85J TaxID=2862949 RepID=UPI001CD3A8D8|nr:response regulator transcription factor [Nocardia sp. alder85J]MCX4098398.1 response regulator transcription factor [Nocardia sp. alder85J]